MIEFIFMVAVVAIVFIFFVTPCFLGVVFDFAPSKYMDSVKAGLYFLGAIVVLFIFVLVIGLSINFLSGDPQPITTLIERITEGAINE